MKRYTFIPILLLFGGCAHFEDRPIDPQSNQSAFEARTLADPGLLEFMKANRPKADVSKDWNAAGLTLAAFYYRAVGTIPCRELCFAAVAAFCLNLVPAPFPYLG